MKVEKVAVVVLGELSRSPRMWNHLRELSAAGMETVVFGYAAKALDLPPGVSLRPLRALPRIGEDRSKIFFLAGSAVRMGLLFCTLTAALIRARPARILVQTPPGFPTLLAAWLAARCVRARLIVDWHNYSYSLLALRLGSAHWFVKLAARYERWMAPRADEHLCVSHAMAKDLETRCGVGARVLYDVPVRVEDPGDADAASDRKLVAVSPCGWTADERVDLLLDALDLLSADPRRGDFSLHITGDGPLRARLQPRVARLRRAGLEIHTGFRNEKEYRELIRAARVGISLHDSASGLDLAMKNVDLFAARVPVCALDYGGCLAEQVRPGENGYLFRTAGELAELLLSFLNDPAPLDAARRKMLEHTPATWDREWKRVALPLLTGGS